MDPQLTAQMILVLLILALTIFMFVSEIVRVDVAALVVMVLLGLTELFQPYAQNGVVTPWLAHHAPALAAHAPWLNEMLAPVVPIADLFSGFESNAVISIIAVMIIGAGLDRTGLMTRVAGFILKVGGSTEKRVIPLISATVGVISSFMQNVGAAALFIPVVSRISARTGLPLSRLLMPMGFCAILGGTLTMVGSSPVILLNDLILTSNKTLPAGVAPMRTFDLFSITPIGLAMLVVGILYFVLFGRWVLPATPSKGSEGASTMDYLRETYGLECALHEVHVPAEGVLVGMNIGDIERRDWVRIVGLQTAKDSRIAPSKDIVVEAGNMLAVMAPVGNVEAFAERNDLNIKKQLETFAELLVATRAGVSEVVIPPSSRLIGKTVREIWMRRNYGLAVLALHRVGETITTGVRDIPLQAGDTLICHSAWEDLAKLEHDRNFVVVTTEFPHEETRPHKVPHALLFFGLALALVLFTDLKLSTALLTGAVGMILSGVLNIDEAYQAVSWKTVFLLASLIPLGLAVEVTGTAAWIAHQTLTLLHGVPIWVLQAAIAVLATVFTLVMSNVGATVLLVPLAVNIAIGAGANPAVFALTVAIATSNSFLIPTHQVNALIMGPGGYRVADFMRAGGIMTLLFLVVMMVMLNLMF